MAGKWDVWSSNIHSSNSVLSRHDASGFAQYSTNQLLGSHFRTCRLVVGKRQQLMPSPGHGVRGAAQRWDLGRLGRLAPLLPGQLQQQGLLYSPCKANTSPSYSLLLNTGSHTVKEKKGTFNLDCFCLGRTLENLNCTVKRDKHCPTFYTYAPTLHFLFPTGTKNETFHSRPKLAGLAEIKHCFSKGLSIQREMPTKLQSILGLIDS